MRMIRIAIRNLTFRPVLSVTTMVLLGLAVGLAVAILLLAQALETGLVKAARPFDLLVGAKGSHTQLIMSTMLLQDAPIGNVPYSLFEQLRDDPRVAHAAPLALGDSVGGAPLVGVTDAFFTLADPATRKPYFTVREGRLPDASIHEHTDENKGERVEEWEAVVGARSGLWSHVTTTFQSHHGATGEVPGEAHKAFYTVVGVLEETGTPLDRAMFVPLQSYWDVHHKGEETAAENREVTAIMVRPKGIADFYQLNQEINRGAMAQAVASGAGLTQLFDLLGEGKTILSMVSYLALVMASATVFLASYAVGAQRRRETAILRALGAGRWLVSGLALLESLALAAGGAVLGLALGHAVAWAIASRIQESSALAVRPGFLPSEALVVAAILVLALAAGAIPALQSYRQDVAASLAPT